MLDIERQLELEEESMGLGVRRYREQLLPWGLNARAKSQESDLPPGQVQLRRVMKPVATNLEAWMEKALSGRANKLAGMAKVIEQMDRDVVIYLTCKRIINSLSQSETLQKVAQGISQWLIDEYNYSLFKKASPGYCYVISESLKKSTSAKHKAAVIRNSMDKAGLVKFEMTLSERTRLGTILIDLFIQATGMVEVKLIHRRRNKTVNIIAGTKEIMEWLKDAHSRCELLAPVHLPMISPPIKWTTPFDGGYYNREIYNPKLVKTRNSNYMEELKHWDMPRVYQAVNAIQDTAWRINKPVLEIMKEVWDSGSSIGNLPLRDDEPLPTKPLDIATNEDSRRDWKRKAAKIHAINRRVQSKRVAVSQKIWIASKFADEEAIYFPHVLDWRGRVYPLPTLVNPQADDSGKALLEFSEGMPLGDSGGYWLAVHIANLFGVDKVSLDERVQWVQEHSAEICMSALEPLDYQFWVTADKPYQALAACIEWNGFMTYGDSFVSHLPIAMDGSNNGLQHFAMVMRDEESGRAVNLLPADKPEDIYQKVADVVAAVVERDAKQGDLHAQSWNGKIDRAICKRPVMTLPYGATRYGMSDQIMEEVRKLEEKGKDYDLQDTPADCTYLAGVVYDSIGLVVVAARRAMDWLQESARVAASDGLPVRWTAPSGFPVMQEYRQSITRTLKISMGNVRVKMQINDDGQGKLNKKRQALGISPNVVHSWDAAHLVSTVNLCQGQGFTSFAMIHDSYGCHASLVDHMQQCIRQAFVDQYGGNLLEDLNQQLMEQLPPELCEKIPVLPEAGALDPQQVLESDYFFA